MKFFEKLQTEEKLSRELYINNLVYSVKEYSEDRAVKLTRLIREDAMDLVRHQAGRPDWRGVDPRLNEWAQTFCARLTKKRIPFFVIEAMRSEARQRELYEQGRTLLKTGSKHAEGLAVDIVHGKFFWSLSEGEWAAIGMLGMTLAHEMKLPMRWGGDWDLDGDIRDQKLFDPAHWELIEQK